MRLTAIMRRRTSRGELREVPKVREKERRKEEAIWRQAGCEAVRKMD